MSDTDVSAALQQWRARYGLTQAQAAKYLCVSPRTLQGWEAGRGAACAALLLKLLAHSPPELALFLQTLT